MLYSNDWNVTRRTQRAVYSQLRDPSLHRLTLCMLVKSEHISNEEKSIRRGSIWFENIIKPEFVHDVGHFRAVCNISNMRRNSVSSGYPNTEERVEKTTCSGVFLTRARTKCESSLPFGQAALKFCLPWAS